VEASRQPGGRSYRRYHRHIPSPTRPRPALGLAVIAAVMIAAAVTLLAVAKDDGREPAPADGPTGVTALGAPGDDLPAAPWRAGAVPRSAVPGPFADAWDRAANRATCALLFPLDGGRQLKSARPGSEKTPGDKGWDIFLTAEAGTIEVLAVFDKATLPQKPSSAASFTRTWSDGSVAKYSADVGNVAPGSPASNSAPFEAVLTLPDQSCAYRVYDTLGKNHLEYVFDRLRLMG
jgi:hypothetical protein